MCPRANRIHRLGLAAKIHDQTKYTVSCVLSCNAMVANLGPPVHQPTRPTPTMFDRPTCTPLANMAEPGARIGSGGVGSAWSAWGERRFPLAPPSLSRLADRSFAAFRAETRLRLVCVAMSKPAHSWERLSGRWRQMDGGSGDAEPGGADSPSGEGSTSDDGGDPSGATLVSLLLDHYLHSRLSAQQVCTLMHYAAGAGVSAAARYALSPSAPSGHASRKLRNVLGHSRDNGLYEAEVPGHGRHDVERSSHSVSFLPFHEQLAEELHDPSDARRRLLKLKAEGALPPAYLEHPVVRQHPDQTVLPVAIFIDAVPYSLTDSVLGIWGVDVLSGRRFLCGAFRKRNMCRCGCKGWCSYYALFSVATWSIEALAAGTWPRRRHDGRDWLASDSMRQSKAGSALPFTAACLYIKGDWAEYAHTFGLPSWSDGMRPCWACSAVGPDMFVAAGNTASTLRWALNEPGDFEADCARCEIKVRVSAAEQKDRIATLLQFDKRPTGSLGLSLVSGLPEFGLRVGDRLEPSPSLPDVGKLADAALPIVLTFWRRSAESLCRHRNPLFRADLGLQVETALTVDILHAINLGVMNTWCRVAAWELLLSGVYGARASGPEGRTTTVLAMRAKLFAFYKRRRAQHPEEVLTHLNDLTPAMLGTVGKQRCKVKGAECWCLLLFLLEEIEQFGQRVGNNWQRLIMAGRCLESMIVGWRRASWVLSDQQIEDIVLLAACASTSASWNLMWSARSSRYPCRSLVGRATLYVLPLVRRIVELPGWLVDFLGGLLVCLAFGA